MPINARIALAWLSLWLERIWNGLWPTQAVVLVLAAIAIVGLLPALGPWLHSLLLAAAAAWLGWMLWRRREAWRLPSKDEAVRKLEQDSGVPHRPLHGMADKPLADDPAGRRLWQAHQRQLAAHLARLQPQAPESALPRIDRFAWRAGALLAVVAALFIAGHDWRYNIGNTLQPRFAVAAADQVPAVDLWIEPPAYTRRPPVYAAVTGEPLRVPVGSTLVARVSFAYAPMLTIGATAYPMQAEAEDSFALSLDLEHGGQMVIQSGADTLAQWSLQLVPDQPPTAAFAEPPSETERQALRIDYLFEDDYGIAEAQAEISLHPGEGKADWDNILNLPFPLPGTEAQQVRSAYFGDLTPHRWAGRKVMIRLHATDGIGQTGESETVSIVLPERVFTHPVARQIIAARKQLDAGAERRDVSMALARIAQYPPRFNDDVAVFLGLSSSMHRLRLNRDEASKQAVRNVLWDLALRLEDGDLPGAERDLRAAQQALQEALARDADDAEIRRLIEELRQAMRRFASEMARQTPENAPLDQSMTPQNSVSDQDLERMLDQIQEMAESGSREAAQELLSQLQQMMEGIQSAQPMSDAQRQQAEAMTQMLNQLQEMQRRQQALIDETFRQSQEGQPAPTGPPEPNAGQPQSPFSMPNFGFPNLNMPNFGQPMPPQSPQPGQQPGQQGEPMPGLAQQQDQLRRDLGELMRQMGEQLGGIPGDLQQAEQAMRAARESLQQGAGGPALDAEGEALERLRQASQDMQQQFSQQMGTNPGPGTAAQQPGGQQEGQRDPLGRERNEGQATEFGPRIPNESETQRARRIRDTLYERSADPDRPVLEQDYLRRLLERF